MSDNASFLALATAGLLCVAFLVGGPTYCAMNDAAQLTERVKAACAGDLSEPARAAACTLAVSMRERR